MMLTSGRNGELSSVGPSVGSSVLLLVGLAVAEAAVVADVGEVGGVEPVPLAGQEQGRPTAALDAAGAEQAPQVQRHRRDALLRFQPGAVALLPRPVPGNNNQPLSSNTLPRDPSAFDH